MDTWIRAHNKLKTYIEADRYYVEKLIDKTLKMGDVFNIWSQENIFTKDFSTFSNDELFSLYEQFRYKMKMLDAYGMILSIMDFRDFSFVEGNMKSFLESKTSSVEEFQEYYDICTYPLYNSYAQDQEEALLELMSEFYSGQWSKDILQGTVESNITEEDIESNETFALERESIFNASGIGELPEIGENITITNETAPDGVLPNESKEIVIVNETIMENVTENNLTIETIQYGAVLNRPVKWKKKINVDDVADVIVEIPKEAENITFLRLLKRKQKKLK